VVHFNCKWQNILPGLKLDWGRRVTERRMCSLASEIYTKVEEKCEKFAKLEGAYL
jgi:hypothetical protein